MKTQNLFFVVCFVALVSLAGCKFNVESCIAYYGTSPLPIEDTIKFFECTLLQAPGVTYYWNFGDGTTATGQTVLHHYTVAGSFDVNLTVSGKGKNSSTSKPITIVGATSQDYAGTYKVHQACFACDTAYLPGCLADSSTYTSTITANGPNAVVIHNYYNQGVDANAAINEHTITLPALISGNTTFKTSPARFDTGHTIFTYGTVKSDSVLSPPLVELILVSYTKQ